jgi:acyl-CoA dehydrogenase
MESTYVTPEHIALRDALRRFLEQEAVPYFPTWEHEQCVPRTFWRKMGAQGFLCPMVDERYGGAALTLGMQLSLRKSWSEWVRDFWGLGCITTLSFRIWSSTARLSKKRVGCRVACV